MTKHVTIKSLKDIITNSRTLKDAVIQKSNNIYSVVDCPSLLLDNQLFTLLEQQGKLMPAGSDSKYVNYSFYNLNYLSAIPFYKNLINLTYNTVFANQGEIQSFFKKNGYACTFGYHLQILGQHNIRPLKKMSIIKGTFKHNIIYNCAAARLRKRDGIFKDILKTVCCLYLPSVNYQSPEQYDLAVKSALKWSKG